MLFSDSSSLITFGSLLPLGCVHLGLYLQLPEGSVSQARVSPVRSRLFRSCQQQQASPEEYSILYHLTPSKGAYIRSVKQDLL